MPALVEGDMTELQALGYGVAIHVMDPLGTRRRDLVHCQQLAHPHQERPAAAGGAPVRYLVPHALVLDAIGHTGALRRHEAIEAAQIGGLQIKLPRRFLPPLHLQGACQPVAPAILLLQCHGHPLDPAFEAAPILLPDGEACPQLHQLGILHPHQGRIQPVALGEGSVKQQAAGGGTLHPSDLGLVQTEATLHLPQLTQGGLGLLVGIAGQPEGEQLP